MRKVLFLFAFQLISQLLFSQAITKTYRLTWKPEKDEIIAYKMETINLEDPKLDINSGFLSLLDSLSKGDSTNVKREFLKKMIENSVESTKNTDKIATIEKKAQKIYVRILVKDKEPLKAKPLNDSVPDLGQLAKGIQFRGYLNENGSIYSFFLQSRQKNLLALYFQLPEYKVKVGDSWALDLQMISMDYQFLCDSADNKNSVTLLKTYQKGSDTIAVLKYQVEEYINGNYKDLWSGQKKPVKMEMKYYGSPEFNISKGRWEVFNMIMTVLSKGYQESSSKQLYKLTETKLTQSDLRILEEK
jgi:hypothetical protein